MTSFLKTKTRTMLAASVFALAAGGAFAETTVTAVMHSDLRILDPVLTTAHITRDHAYMIYDVLVAQDADFKVQPQMADFSASDDGLVHTFTLRDGLKFHDGAAVTAADVVASLQRWGKRDPGGQMIFDRTGSLEAKDDKTVVWTLSKPFNPLLEILSKPSGVPPFIMPKRIADSPVDKAIEEHIGSGPFMFVKEEFQPGIGVTYVKNPNYVPRSEPASGYAGGKVVNVDKVRWLSMADASTAVNALQSGDIDMMELVPIDLIPLLDGDDDVVVSKRSPFGLQTMGRMNFKHPPFDNVDIRRAAFLALSQEPVLAAMMGNPDYYKVCGAIFGCGMPLESQVGTETLTGKGDPEGAKAMLAKAGYDNTPIVLMAPTDVASLKAQPVVTAQLLRNAGFNVDLQAMDWQTLVGRRASMDAPDKGGWNIFFTNWEISEISSPMVSGMLSGRGDKGWFGWPEDAKMEELKEEYINATTPEEQKTVAEKIQAHAMDVVTYVPLGEYGFPQGLRASVTGQLATPVPVFWNLSKSE